MHREIASEEGLMGFLNTTNSNSFKQIGYFQFTAKKKKNYFGHYLQIFLFKKHIFFTQNNYLKLDPAISLDHKYKVFSANKFLCFKRRSS